MKYPALRFIAILSKVIAMLIFWGGVLAVFMFIRQGQQNYENPAANYIYLVAASASVLILLTSVLAYASGELIYVFLDIEENTRTSGNRQGGV
jgi:hypothetical protein